MLDVRAVDANGIRLCEVAFRDARLHRGDLHKWARIVSKIDITRAKHKLIFFDGSCETERHQPIVLRIRQAAKQKTIDDAENGSRRADSERERENRDECERRTFREHAKGESEIENERIDEGNAALIAIGFFCLFDAAEFALCSGPGIRFTHAAADVLFGQELEMLA